MAITEFTNVKKPLTIFGRIPKVKWNGACNAMGEKHGYGQYWSPSGDYFVGYYEDGVKSGQGTYKWLKGNSYEGEWVNGK